MIFGGLSEQEVEKIEKLLKEENIPYKVGMDEQMLEKNKELNSLSHTHLRAGDPISSHVIAIEIDEKDFKNMSESLKENLFQFGITNEAPSEADFYSPEDPYKEKPTSSKTIITILLILGFSVLLYNLLKDPL